MTPKIILKSCFFLCFILSFYYLFNHATMLNDFIWQQRLIKLYTYLLVVLALIPTTVVFQTLVQSHYLSPSILGIDSLYVFIQTLVYFSLFKWVPIQALQTPLGFLLHLGLMIIGYFTLFFFLRKKQQIHINDTLLLLGGLVFSQILRSFSSFLQILMDPNDYDQLQAQLFPSFQAISVQLLISASLIICFGLIYIWHVRYQLDLLQLGYDNAQSLGIPVKSLRFTCLLIIILMTGTATALVGPISFLGFISANLTYMFSQQARHTEYILLATQIGFILIVGGQILVEQVFNYQYHLNIMIEVIGGSLFFFLLYRKMVNH